MRAIWLKEAKRCREAGQPEAALVFYDRIIEADMDDNGWAHYLKGSSLVELGRKEEAVVCFKEALELDPCGDIYAFDLGRLYYEMGRFEQARHSFQWVIDHQVVFGSDRKAREWLARLEEEGKSEKGARDMAIGMGVLKEIHQELQKFGLSLYDFKKDFYGQGFAARASIIGDTVVFTKPVSMADPSYRAKWPAAIAAVQALMKEKGIKLSVR